MNPEQVDKNEMTVAVLRTVKFFVNHGFYESQKELIQVAEPVISLLNGSTKKKPVDPNEEVD